MSNLLATVFWRAAMIAPLLAPQHRYPNGSIR